MAVALVLLLVAALAVSVISITPRCNSLAPRNISVTAHPTIKTAAKPTNSPFPRVLSVAAATIDTHSKTTKIPIAR